MLEEEVLGAWLGLSLTIDNVRIASSKELTFNDMMICNLLIRQERENKDKYLTATDLTGALKMHKSQMNGILTGLEKRGMIERARSEEDRRVIYVKGTDKMKEVYAKEHMRILRIVRSVTKACGEEDMRELVRLIGRVIETIQLEEQEQ